MSYNTSLQTNNAELQALIDIANALPDATDGVELPTLTTPASETEVFEGYEYIDQEGTAKVGTFTIENELSEQDELLTELEEILDGKASGGGTAFPYEITLTSTGLDVDDPVFCYGNDGDTVVVFTQQNASGVYAAEWSATNCEIGFVGYNGGGTGSGMKAGDFAIMYGFTADAVIQVDYTFPGGYE